MKFFKKLILNISGCQYLKETHGYICTVTTIYNDAKGWIINA